MRVLVLVKATADSEAGRMPCEASLAAMARYNEELMKAGVLLAGEGLHPSARGARVHGSGARRTVVDGPFAPTKDLVAGFWMLQVRTFEEAIEWVKRAPNPTDGADGEIEIRRIFESEDFEAACEPASGAQEERPRAAGAPTA